MPSRRRSRVERSCCSICVKRLSTALWVRHPWQRRHLHRFPLCNLSLSLTWGERDFANRKVYLNIPPCITNEERRQPPTCRYTFVISWISDVFFLEIGRGRWAIIVCPSVLLPDSTRHNAARLDLNSKLFRNGMECTGVDPSLLMLCVAACEVGPQSESHSVIRVPPCSRFATRLKPEQRGPPPFITLVPSSHHARTMDKRKARGLQWLPNDCQGLSHLVQGDPFF
jgi:hypothetical protein